MFMATSAYAKIFAPLGARPGSGTNAEAANAVALLRSFEVNDGTASYRHLALNGAKQQTMFCCASKLNPRFLIFHSRIQLENDPCYSPGLKRYPTHGSVRI